jgi:hypothetical protein
LPRLHLSGDVTIQLGAVDQAPRANPHDSKPAVGGLALDGADADAQAGGGFGEGEQHGAV